MDLSIVIVSWNARDYLRKCLTSIYKNSNGLETEIFVVDNGSGDESAGMVRKEFPGVKLIISPKEFLPDAKPFDMRMLSRAICLERCRRATEGKM